MTTIDGSKAGGGFEKFGEDAEWFRKKLAEEGVKLNGGSPMDEALKAMSKIADTVTYGIEPELPNGEALLRLLTDGVGGRNLVQFVRKAVGIDPGVFDGKWWLFRGPDALLARYRGQSSTRNFIWELYVAARCLLGTKDVQVARANENPDVRCSLGDDIWGIECKVPDSRDPERLMKLVKEAARQLQGTDIDRGVIAVNLTSVLDHSRFARSIAQYDTSMYTPSDIMDELQRQVKTLVRPYASAAFGTWIKNRRKPRAILFHADAIALAGKTVAMTTYQNWFDLHHPGRNPLIVPFMWPEAADRAMASVFDMK